MNIKDADRAAFEAWYERENKNAANHMELDDWMDLDPNERDNYLAAWQAALAYARDRDNIHATAPGESFIDIVFDSSPGPDPSRFVEVENDQGISIKFGEWVRRPDGYWALRFAAPEVQKSTKDVAAQPPAQPQIAL